MTSSGDALGDGVDDVVEALARGAVGGIVVGLLITADGVHGLLMMLCVVCVFLGVVV